MNTPTTSTPDLEALRKAVQEFQPNPHRVPFSNLKPVHDSIAKLRKQNVSYSAIADLLQQHGVKTSRARVAEYGRIVLEGGKSRKRRKWAKSMLVINAPIAPQNTPAAGAKPAPTMTAPTGYVSPQTKENSPYTSHGPCIAKVAMMSPGEKAELDAFLKAGSASKP